jgi:hypothetical protein
MRVATAKHDPEQLEVTIDARDLKKVPAGVKSVSLWFDKDGRWLQTARGNHASKQKKATPLPPDVLVQALALSVDKMLASAAKTRNAALRKARRKAERQPPRESDRQRALLPPIARHGGN